MKLVGFLLVLLPVIAVLAILGKRQISHNKDGSWLVPKLAGRLQKLEVLYGRALEDATGQYMEQRFRHFMAGLGILWILGVGILLLPVGDQDSGQIRRPEAGEDATGISVQLTDGEQTTEFTLEVEARSMTKAEITDAVNDAVKMLETEIPGRNRSLDYVTEDLSFPDRDRTGRLEISWDTDDLAVIGRNGTVRRDELEKACEVTITAKLGDGIRTEEASFRAKVIPKTETETAIEKALRTLSQMEESGRKEAVFQLPEQVEGVAVKEQKISGREMICKVYPILILAAGAVFLLHESKEKEKLKGREERLSAVFYRFVKRLTLLLGAGESLQDSLLTAAAVEERFLTREVLYAVNRIRTGTAESKAYAELGRGLGLQSYVRLFSTISTAAPRGSSQLLNLLEQEVKDAEAEAKETARRRGEQASQKLLLPMFLLLIVVIGIVLYPAIAGM